MEIRWENAYLGWMGPYKVILMEDTSSYSIRVTRGRKLVGHVRLESRLLKNAKPEAEDVMRELLIPRYEAKPGKREEVVRRGLEVLTTRLITTLREKGSPS